MKNFIANIVKQVKSLIASQDVDILKLVYLPAFENVGIMILKTSNLEKVVQILTKKNKKTYSNKQFQDKLLDVLTKIKKNIPQNVIDYYSKILVSEMINARNQQGTIFKKKMDEVEQVVREQFIKLAQQLIQNSFDIQEELKKWNV